MHKDKLALDLHFISCMTATVSYFSVLVFIAN